MNSWVNRYSLYTFYTDASFNESTKEAVILITENDKIIYKDTVIAKDNNEAELLAVIWTLKYIRENKLSKIKTEILVDSQNIVNMIKGFCRSGQLKSLVKKAKGLRSKYCEVVWVPRYGNKAGIILDGDPNFRIK